MSDDELLRIIAKGAPNPAEFAATLKAMSDAQLEAAIALLISEERA